MKQVFLMAALVISANVFGLVTGSQCGLTDSKDENWEVTAKRILSETSNAKINELPTLTKQQLIISAKAQAERYGDDPSAIRNTIQAVAYLRDRSTANDVIVYYYDVNGRRVTEVTIYPGENPYGNIFETGSKRIIADNSDDSISCR